MLANQICFPKSSCVPPEKILKIPIFRARVHSVIWLEYVSVLFDLVGIFGEFICAHTLYFFEKTDVGTGGTTPKRSSTGVFDVTDITLDLNCDLHHSAAPAAPNRKRARPPHSILFPLLHAMRLMAWTGRSRRAGRPYVEDRRVLAERSCVEGRRVVAGQPHVEGRRGCT